MITQGTVLRLLMPHTAKRIAKNTNIQKKFSSLNIRIADALLMSAPRLLFYSAGLTMGMISLAAQETDHKLIWTTAILFGLGNTTQ